MRRLKAADNCWSISSVALAAFKDQQCKIGRARIFGERTVGMDDPGMVAIARMLDCLK